MADHEIAPGAFVTNVTFSTQFHSVAATPKFENITDPDPFKWRVVTGQPLTGSAAAVGPVAMSATFTFVPKNVPNGFRFGVKQLAFHKGETSIFQGNASFDGSILAGSTSVNFTWVLDVSGAISAAVLQAPSFPFFLSNPIAVANGTTGSIEVKDSPGGSQRLVRANLVTAKRNFLASHKGATDFVAFLVVVKPDSAHVALEGFAWTFRHAADVTWSDGKPTLSASGDASFLNKLAAGDITGDRLRLLEDNSLRLEDTIGFKLSNSKIDVEVRDAAMPVRSPSGPKDDIVISARAYSVTHSAKASQ